MTRRLSAVDRTLPLVAGEYQCREYMPLGPVARWMPCHTPANIAPSTAAENESVAASTTTVQGSALGVCPSPHVDASAVVSAAPSVAPDPL